MRKDVRRALGRLVGPAALALGLIWCAAAVEGLESGRGEEDRRQLEEAIRRACVTCYAAEGSYPAELSELEARYGLQVDEERYLVHYEVFAENLMPEIMVLERER